MKIHLYLKLLKHKSHVQNIFIHYVRRKNQNYVILLNVNNMDFMMYGSQHTINMMKNIHSHYHIHMP